LILYYDSDSDSESNIIKKKKINLIEPENSIKEISLYEINTTSEDNNDKQYLEFETIDDTRQINYDTNYCNNSSGNNKLKNNNPLNKTENKKYFFKKKTILIMI